ncbi:hypothetical protein EMIT0P74_50225 [Pseudomonas sp. IT-P74]
MYNAAPLYPKMAKTLQLFDAAL